MSFTGKKPRRDRHERHADDDEDLCVPGEHIKLRPRVKAEGRPTTVKGASRLPQTIVRCRFGIQRVLQYLAVICDTEPDQARSGASHGRAQNDQNDKYAQKRAIPWERMRLNQVLSNFPAQKQSSQEKEEYPPGSASLQDAKPGSTMRAPNANLPHEEI